MDIAGTVFVQATQLPERLSVDKQTIMFHGASKSKTRIKYKKTYNLSSCDSICATKHSVTFYFRCQSAPRTYIEQGLSPLHSHIMLIFGRLKNQNHSVDMDNLYMSVTFA